MGQAPNTNASEVPPTTATTPTPPPQPDKQEAPPEGPDLLIKEWENATTGKNRRKMYRRTLLAIEVTGACRRCAAGLARSSRGLPSRPRRHRVVFRAFYTFRALSLRISVVSACMSRALCTAVEPDYDDEGVRDADKESASDLDMYTQSSEGEGEEWASRDETRGRQLTQQLFSHTHTQIAASSLQHAFAQHTSELVVLTELMAFAP